ncbi:MAG TPA: c-type cytochrome [Candidatus Acidoferrales bacterium]|nr:c-type cytochrome [Candidatus Acidoferrales bacterium]
MRTAIRILCLSICLALASPVFPQGAGPSQARTLAGGSKAKTSEGSAGQQPYVANCASCHGLDGRGGERAPDIVMRPRVRELSDAAILGILEKGVPNTAMPAFRFLTASTRRSLVAYLRILQGARADVALPGNAARGRELFFGKGRCSSCHMVQSEGGFFAADLTNFGAGRGAGAIRSAIVAPNRDLDPRRRTIVATLPSGEILEGVARNEDNFSLQLLTPDGRLHLLSKTSLTALTYRDESPMPGNYGQLLSSSELDDLVKFLASTAGPPPAQRHKEEESGDE